VASFRKVISNSFQLEVDGKHLIGTCDVDGTDPAMLFYIFLG
jgi:hypothetical protein